jgi:Putative threonine efflux protein
MVHSLPFIAFIVIAAFTPGPNNCMALSHASRGLQKGVLFSAGVFMGMLIVMLLCGFLSGILARTLAIATVFMKILGVAYMVWLAWNLWNSGDAPRDPICRGETLFWTGCVLQLVNPKLIAYGMTAFSTFILPFYSDSAGILRHAILLALVGFAGTLAWAFCGAALQTIFRHHPVAINRALASMVFCCALSLLA